MKPFLARLREANITRTIEWSNVNTKPFEMMFFANELGGEVGEAQNVLKKLDREHTYRVKGSRDTFDHLGEELSDIIICCDLLGMRMDIEFPEDCWPAVDGPSTRMTTDFSLMGCMLGSLSGRVCGISVHYSTHVNKNQLTTALQGLVKFTKALSDRMDYDLQKLTTDKFNATSTKLNFKTVLS